MRICMTYLMLPARRVLLALSICIGALYGQATLAAPVMSTTVSKPSLTPSLELEAFTGNPTILGAVGTDSGASALNAVSRGRWASACSVATAVLAHRVADVDALGVFAICSAVDNDTVATSKAIDRLREAEPLPYYGLLTQGILRFKEGLPDKAEEAFNSVLHTRASDPIAWYFKGEALHARQKNADAISAFKAVLKIWPDHTPALIAAARLLAAPNASKDNLNEALTMTERATSINPTNLAQWKLLAELCERTGQHNRANAIAVQWLSGPLRVK